MERGWRSRQWHDKGGKGFGEVLHGNGTDFASHRLEHDRLRRKLSRSINQSQRPKATSESFRTHLRKPKSPKNWAKIDLFNPRHQTP